MFGSDGKTVRGQKSIFGLFIIGPNWIRVGRTGALHGKFLWESTRSAIRNNLHYACNVAPNLVL